jgi:hypothetical protein
MSQTRAPKVRVELNSIISRLPSAGLTNEEIVRELMRTSGHIVKIEIDDIIEAGLKKIAGEVLAWRSRSKSTVQLELFKEYGIPENYTLRIPGKKPIHKNLSDMTYADAKLYVAQHERPRLPSRKVAEVARFLAFADSIKAKPHDKLLEIWEEARGTGSGGPA